MDLFLEAEILVDSSKDKVWAAIVTPDIIAKYFFGTQVNSNWKKGSSITFSGIWEGKAYQDKGIILDIIPKELLVYNYWSSFSGLVDKKDNYSLVTYNLDQIDGMTRLKLKQQGFSDNKARDHSIAGWQGVLGRMKKTIEDGFSI